MRKATFKYNTSLYNCKFLRSNIKMSTLKAEDFLEEFGTIINNCRVMLFSEVPFYVKNLPTLKKMLRILVGNKSIECFQMKDNRFELVSCLFG